MSIEMLWASWPMLFEPKWFIQHFCLLVGADVHDTIMNGIRTKGMEMINYARGVKRCMQEIATISAAERQLNSKAPWYVGALAVLCILMKEDLKLLFRSAKVCWNF